MRGMHNRTAPPLTRGVAGGARVVSAMAASRVTNFRAAGRLGDGVSLPLDGADTDCEVEDDRGSVTPKLMAESARRSAFWNDATAPPTPCS